MGTSHTRAFTARFRPFKDDLTKEIPVLFFQVPDSHPPGPESVFVDRWWDEREHFEPATVGVVPGSMKPYFGPLPDCALKPVVGTPDQFVNGLLWSVYSAGGYTNPNGCVDVLPNVRIARFRQSQSIVMHPVRRWWIFQAQQLLAPRFEPLAFSPVLPQAQQVEVAIGWLVSEFLQQAQEVNVEVIAPIVVGVQLPEAQQLLVNSSIPPDLPVTLPEAQQIPVNMIG